MLRWWRPSIAHETNIRAQEADATSEASGASGEACGTRRDVGRPVAFDHDAPWFDPNTVSWELSIREEAMVGRRNRTAERIRDGTEVRQDAFGMMSFVRGEPGIPHETLPIEGEVAVPRGTSAGNALVLAT